MTERVSAGRPQSLTVQSTPPQEDVSVTRLFSSLCSFTLETFPLSFLFLFLCSPFLLSSLRPPPPTPLL